MTKRQLELLTFFRDYRLKSGGVGASIYEAKKALGTKSDSYIERAVDALEVRGFVRRVRGAARSVEVIRMPEGAL